MNKICNYVFALGLSLLGAGVQASPDWVYATHANISIPEGSSLVHKPNLEDETFHEFIGQIELVGNVQVAWFRWILEDSTEVEMELLFVPEEGEYRKLPLVQHPLEPVTLPSVIQLTGDKEQKVALLKLFFGAKLASDIVKKQLNRTVGGSITFNAYQTLVACDRRFFRASVDTFKATEKVQVLGRLPKLGC